MFGENEVGGRPGRGCRWKAVEHHDLYIFLEIDLCNVFLSIHGATHDRARLAIVLHLTLMQQI